MLTKSLYPKKLTINLYLCGTKRFARKESEHSKTLKPNSCTTKKKKKKTIKYQPKCQRIVIK
jgi:hypothetical protein